MFQDSRIHAAKYRSPAAMHYCDSAAELDQATGLANHLIRLSDWPGLTLHMYSSSFTVFQSLSDSNPFASCRISNCWFIATLLCPLVEDAVSCMFGSSSFLPFFPIQVVVAIRLSELSSRDVDSSCNGMGALYFLLNRTRCRLVLSRRGKMYAAPLLGALFSLKFIAILVKDRLYFMGGNFSVAGSGNVTDRECTASH